MGPSGRRDPLKDPIQAMRITAEDEINNEEVVLLIVSISWVGNIFAGGDLKFTIIEVVYRVCAISILEVLVYPNTTRTTCEERNCARLANQQCIWVDAFWGTRGLCGAPFAKSLFQAFFPCFN